MCVCVSDPLGLFQYMEAWYITVNAVQEKPPLAWSQFTGKLKTQNVGLKYGPLIYGQNQCWFQVVGDRKGSVFGGLVEAPLIPTDKKYQVWLPSPKDPIF